ncbi:MAG TPA: hypothetical protein VFK05_19575 [Polyangiaceae bacterium]|nr:hypothetical protein [Polyangiaceae bacterium]
MNELKTAAFAVSLALALALAPRAAQAQEWTRQSFLLPKGDFEITGSPARPDLVRFNLSRNAVFEPVEFPVNFFWGVHRKVMIGITHEHGLRINSGQPDPKFRDTYNDVGFGSVIFLGGDHNFEVDLHAGLPLHQLSPVVFVGVQAGILGRANLSRRVALYFDPSLYFGFNHRNDGNGDELHLPIWVYFQPTPVVAPFVGTALEGTFKNFGDDFRVPIEGGVLFTVARGIHIGAMLRFPNAIGAHDPLYGDSRLDWRELSFLGQFRF